jgi:hypothetical protein
VLAPPASPVRLAAVRAASFCRLEAALLLAPLAASMRLAVLSIAYSPLGAALQFTLPLAHGPPPISLPAETQTPLRRAIHSRSPTPSQPSTIR